MRVLDEWPAKAADAVMDVSEYLDGRIYEFTPDDARKMGMAWVDNDPYYAKHYDAKQLDERVMTSFKGRFGIAARASVGPYQTRFKHTKDGTLIFQFTGPRDCRWTGCVVTAKSFHDGYCGLHDEETRLQLEELRHMTATGHELTDAQIGQLVDGVMPQTAEQARKLRAQTWEAGNTSDE